MKDSQIRYFLGIVDNGMSFTNASRALYIAQPALSRNIAALEEELGVKLFNTSHKNAVKLTAGGAYLYRVFSNYSEKLDNAVQKARKMNNPDVRELKIGIMSDLDMPELIERINAFPRGEKDAILVSLESNDFKSLEYGLLNKAYDLVIAMSPEFRNRKNLSFETLFFVRHILLFSASHKLAAREKPDIFNFKNETLYQPDLSPVARAIVEDYCKSKGFVPKIKSVSNLNTALLALQGGHGYVILDSHHSIAHNPHYRSIELDMQTNVCAIWRKGSRDPVLKAFLRECLNLRNNHAFSRSGAQEAGK